jgi:chromosome segregation ATPase
MISKLESEQRETKEQLRSAQTTLDSLKIDLVKGREELKKTASELCSVRGELSSLDERCTVLQIVERDLTNSVRDKDNALAQSVVEMKAMEREKLARIAELELQLAGISSSFDQLTTECHSLAKEKASFEEANIRVLAENDKLCATLESSRDDNKVLEARLSVIETNCRLAEEEKRACGEEYNNQITKLEHAHRQEVEALKLDLEEKLRASLATCEEKVREVSELQVTIESQRRDFSLALANEIQKQKELYQSQIDQLQKQLRDNDQTMERARGLYKDVAVKEANPLELLDEDESDEVLSGSREDTARKVVAPIQSHRVVHEPAPKKVSPPANKQKKITNKPQMSEKSSKRFASNMVNPNHKRIQAQQQVNQRANKTKKKSKKTLDLFDDVFAFHG